MTRILHVFYSFLPDLTGSSIRSAGLLSGQIAQGMSVVAVSSPFQPGFGPAPVEEYAGIKLYRAYRSGHPLVSEKGAGLWGRVRKIASLPGFIAYLMRVAREEGITHLHAHSTFFCALASLVAARLLGLKVVYEVRSLWEERSSALGWGYRLQARIARGFETLSMRLVDRVVTINEGLKTEIVSRGISASKVDVVPNAVDDSLIEQGHQLEFPERATRFGYVGNISSIEGLELLVDAFRRAFPNGEDVQLLFHGSGPFEPELKQLVSKLGDPRIRVHGRFARGDVESVYRSLDCVVLPRRRTKLNETVTPLKPLEAMAFKRLVGISDVGGLVEVVGSSSNAWVFSADSAEDLALGLRRVHGGMIDVPDMARRGHAYVSQSRAWSPIAKTYGETYARS